MSDHRAPVPDPGRVDAGLIERCREGNADAWDALFDKYYPVAARFVFQLSADFCHEDTEEICQETFLAVVRNLGSFQGKSSFQTWLLRIAANKAMDFRGKSRAEKRGGSFVHFSLDGADEREQIELPRGGPAPTPCWPMRRPLASSGKASINWTTTAARSLSCAIMAI